MNLLKIISENFSFSFSGRVNILATPTKQYLGSIIQKDGNIVNTDYSGLKGKKALATLLMEVRAKKEFSYVSEPEVINPTDEMFQLSEAQFFKFRNNYFEQFDSLKKLRPSDSLTFLLDAKNLGIYIPLTKNEFEVIKVLTSHSLVKDIYQNCKLLDFDTTMALVSLRKKKIILVTK